MARRPPAHARAHARAAATVEFENLETGATWEVDAGSAVCVRLDANPKTYRRKSGTPTEPPATAAPTGQVH